MKRIDLNVDGLPGPTHHFGGLASGNVASGLSAMQPSSPRRAALQAIAKMRTLVALGVPQALFVPHERPHQGLLNALDISPFDSDHQRRFGPWIRCAMSSSGMWTANAATVSASCDTQDGKVHLTPANLVTNLHRSIEAGFNERFLRVLFPDSDHFIVHPPVPDSFPDEGAANWTRLVGESGASYIAVYGRTALDSTDLPRRFIPRQSKEALELIIHRHRLNPDSVLMLKQSETVIDAGVFHNDVIATGHDGLYFMHHSAYTVAPAVVRKWLWTQDQNYELIVFDSGELSLNDVVASYWFNSQLVTAGDGRRMMLAPVQARGVSNDAHIAARFLAAGISEIRWVELDESLKNGGGPACVRLRVPLTPLELGTVCASLLMTPDTLDMLEDWVNSYYRDCLIPDDLATASVIDEGYLALDELTRLLNLGKIYDFQLL